MFLVLTSQFSVQYLHIFFPPRFNFRSVYKILPHLLLTFYEKISVFSKKQHFLMNWKIFYN